MDGEVERGQVLGDRYRLVEAMATDPLVHVWRADDLELQRPVVCKLLHPRWMDDEETVERFRFGAFAATRLDHENVARTYDVERTDGALYTVSEFIDGPDVGELLATGPLPDEAVGALGQQAAAGLRAAHDRGLVHGGVCPENLVVGPRGRLCLIDFGSVQLEHTPGGPPSDPEAWEPGIRRYWAPERSDRGEVEAEGDVYALGLVLWEALTGMAAVEQVAPPGPARRLLDGLTGADATPRRLRGILTDATADDPAARPSAAALAEQLVEVAGVRPHEPLASLLAERDRAG